MIFRTNWFFAASCILNGLIFLVPSPACAADVILGVRVPAGQQLSLTAIDHGVWDKLLHSYVDQRGRVNYGVWKRSQADIQALDQYLQQLSSSNGQGSQEEQLAFWINAYNALTIRGILREYPTSSIRNHTAKVFGYNIWKDLKLIVSGKPVSLDEMEHQILRKMGEPRIHFAIVCASIGCPRLLNEAYRADSLDEQLTNSSRAFLSDSTKFRYDAAQNMFYVSPILEWFGEDFGDSEAARLKRIAAWIPDTRASHAAASGRGSFRFVSYDWGLNDRK